jgi:von Willebrand factor type A domain
MRLAAVLLLLGAFGTAAHAVAAQENPCLVRTVPVNTLTEKGYRYASLVAGDIRASVHGSPVKIISAEPSSSAPRVMIVIDASGSMLGSGKPWALNLGIARLLLSYLPDDSLAGLIVFASGVESHVALPRDREKVKTEIDRVASFRDHPPRRDRATALWDTLSAAIDEFGQEQIGDSIFVITDGEDNLSVARHEVVKRDILNHGLRIFTSEFFVPDGGPTPEERPGPVDMRDLVESSGGYSVRLNPPPNLSTGISLNGTSPAEILLALQLRQLVAYYDVKVELPEPINKPQGWKLQAKSPKLGDLVAFYPRTLMPCSTSGAATFQNSQ